MSFVFRLFAMPAYRDFEHIPAHTTSLFVVLAKELSFGQLEEDPLIPLNIQLWS